MDFPVSVKCYDVLKVPGKRVDMIHTFNTEEEYNHWIRLIEQWDSLKSKNRKSKPAKREILKTVEVPTMIITQYVKEC